MAQGGQAGALVAETPEEGCQGPVGAGLEQGGGDAQGERQAAAALRKCVDFAVGGVVEAGGDAAERVAGLFKGEQVKAQGTQAEVGQDEVQAGGDDRRGGGGGSRGRTWTGSRALSSRSRAGRLRKVS